jgi:glycosyltransferase involved in cell wall biosynthesis
MSTPGERPLVSVLTPTWNRAKFLERVWRGLEKQSYENFEWIVCNDGSSDDTEVTLRQLLRNSRFPIFVISADRRVGKARMDNEAVAVARGHFIVWNDSDDVLVPGALEQLVDAWESIPRSERDRYVGITAFCSDPDGKPLTPFLDEMPLDSTWDELTTKYVATQDRVYFVRSDLLKRNPFPEVDFVIPESSVWCLLGNLKTRVVPKTILVKQYGAPHGISFSGLMEYSRARAYALAISENQSTRTDYRWQQRLWRLLTFIRYSVHGEIPLHGASRLWTPVGSTALFWAVLPAAVVLAAKDAGERKVRKTHREFEQAAKAATFSMFHNLK